MIALELLAAFVLIIGGAIAFTNAVEWLGQRLNLGAGAVGAGEPDATRRDLTWFLALIPVAIVLGVIGAPDTVRYAGAALLVVAYGAYVRRTVKGGGDAGDPEELDPLYFDWTRDDPPSTFQMVAPLATEMPEKANSVLWVRNGKDALALGNITGAMTFQASLPVAFGLVFTDWDLNYLAVTAAVLGFAGGALALWAIPRRHVGVAPVVAWAAMFGGFVVFAALSG